MPDYTLADGAVGATFERRVEARRAGRIGTHLWVRIGGVDATARLRTANLSVTGLYIATEEAVGSPGDLVWVSAATADKARSAQAVARVARVMRQDDRHRGAAVVGAGFEFLPLGGPLPDVVELVRHAAHLALVGSGGLSLDQRTSVRLRRASGTAVVARPVSLHRDHLVVTTSAALSRTESVRLELPDGSAGDLLVPGRVERCDPGVIGADEAAGHRVSLTLSPGDGDGPDARSAESAVTSLVAALVAQRCLAVPPPRLQRLSGQLDRVQLSTLLGLAEATGLDGVLTVASEATAARIYIARGRIVDAESDGVNLAPRQVVNDLLSWTSGEFTLNPVEPRRSPDPSVRRPSFIEDLRVATERHAT